MTNPTTDLAARFEAKREECEIQANRRSRYGAQHDEHMRGRAAAFAEARDMARADAAGGANWTCAARRQGTVGGNDPADCDWPVCGCDPYADKVVAALQESGHLAPPPPAQQGSSSPLSQGDVITMQELAAAICDEAAAYFDRTKGHYDRAQAAGSYRATAKKIRALVPASLATARDGGTGAGDLDWLLKQIVELCEHTEDEMYEALQKDPTNQHEIGFYKGRKWEAKGIRRAISEVVRLRKSEPPALATLGATDQAGEVRDV